MSVTRERMEQALDFLGETDDDCAEAKTDVERQAYRAKHARALEFQRAAGSSAEARKAAAETTESVQSAEDARIAAVLRFEKLKAKRETEGLIVEVWRSLNANRRTGNVT